MNSNKAGGVLGWIMVIVILAALAAVAIPMTSGDRNHLIRACHATQRVLAGAIEDYNKTFPGEMPAVNPLNGSIDQQLLVNKKVLKTLAKAFPVCDYRAIMQPSGEVLCFCMTCGFVDQKLPTVKEEFAESLKASATESQRLNIDFTGIPDFSKLEKDEYKNAVRPPWYKRLGF